MLANRDRAVAVLLAVGMSLALLSGCSASSNTAESDLCRSADQLKSAAATLGALSLDSTSSDVHAAVDEFLTSVTNVSEDLKAAAQSNSAAAKTDLQKVTRPLRNLPADATLAQTVAAIQKTLPALGNAVDQAVDGVDCNANAHGQARS